jgi:hypothetical protein
MQNQDIQDQVDQLKSFELRDFFFIDKMITPVIINVIYWILCLLLVLGTLVSLVRGNFLVIIALPFCLLGIRVMCELFVVMFKISNNLDVIARTGKKDA